MYRNILVGYDGREAGRDALALAASLRAPDGWVAACVYPGHVGSDSVETDLADAASQTVAEAHRRQTAATGSAAAVAALPAHGLHVFSGEVEADLVVIGSSNRGERAACSAGRTGERLLNGSLVPSRSRRTASPPGRAALA